MGFWSRLVNALRGDRLIDDIDEELSAHLAEAIEHGRDPDEARRALGPQLRHREASRDIRQLGWLADVLMDVRYALRGFRRQPVFLAVAVLSLGLGIGANGAIFSVIDALLLRSLPVSDPGQLVIVSDSASENFSYPDYVAMREGTRALSALIAASSTRMVSLDAAGETGQAAAKIVSGNYFAALGVGSAVGRVFTAAEEMQPVAVISQAYWRRRFGASRDIVGHLVTVDHVTLSIVGVAPPGFLGETAGESPDLWATMALSPPERGDRGFEWLYLIGRRRSGATIEEIHDDLASLLMRERSTAPAAETRARLRVGPGARGLAGLKARTLVSPLVIAMGFAILVLLIVCTNLSGLLLARGTARRWEIAMRMAIGASRARVMRQLLAENLLLAGGGGALGIAVAAWGKAALLRLAPSSTPIVLAATHWRTIGFTAAISIAAVVLFGAAPAWRATRTPTLRGSPQIVRGEGGLMRRALIAMQVALSTVLLAGSLMFVATIRNLERRDVGFRVDHSLLIPIGAARGYRPNLGIVVPELLERVSEVRGVASATVALGGTLDAIGGVRAQVEGTSTNDRLAADWVGPGYLRTAGIGLVAGRDFSRLDDERHQKVVIVNEAMARHYFGDALAVGRHVTFNREPYEIIGVARDAKYFSLGETTPAFIYFPTLQTRSGFRWLEVRTTAARSLDLAFTIAAMVRELDPHLSAGAPTTVSDRIDRELGAEHVVADVSGLLGMLALVLLSIGIYGAVAYSVGQRTKEIAVRLALGARRGTIVWMVLGQVVSVLVTGLGAGALGVVFAGRLLKPLLFGIAPADPDAIAVASFLLVCVAVAAAGIPARAASRLDPAAALQE
jgi:putative ABC transport system permease protein